jgi:hypothetical protein
VNSHEVYAELERVRREIATLNYSLPDAYPEWQEAARARLREFEEQERRLLAEFERLDAVTAGTAKPEPKSQRTAKAATSTPSGDRRGKAEAV